MHPIIDAIKDFADSTDDNYYKFMMFFRLIYDIDKCSGLGMLFIVKQ